METEAIESTGAEGSRTRKKSDYLARAQVYAESRGGLCLSTEYQRYNEKMRWQCADGHQWGSSYHLTVYKKLWCPKCAAKTGVSRHRHDKHEALERAQQVAAVHGGECLNSEYTKANDRMRWRCAEGHTWSATWTYVVQLGHWCSTCKRKHGRQRRPDSVPEILDYKAKQRQTNKQYLKNIEGTNPADQALLQDPQWGFLREHMPTEWHCKICQHEWTATWKQVQEQHHGCPNCNAIMDAAYGPVRTHKTDASNVVMN